MKESDSSSNSENENENNHQASNDSGEDDNDLKDDRNDGEASNQILDKETEKKDNQNVEEKKIYDIKIIILGEIGVGKTSVINRFITNTFNEGVKASINIEFQEKSIDLDNETKVNLKIVDTAGEEKHAVLSNQYFKDCEGAIVMYDLTKTSSFTKIKKWLDVLKDKAAEKIVKVLAGNKSDLTDQKVDLKDKLKSYNYDHYEISAKEGNNVDEIFHGLAKKIVEIRKKEGNESIIIPRKNSLTLKANKNEKKHKNKSLFKKC